MIRNDAELISAVDYANPRTARCYRVTVLGRMGESAVYTVEAPTKGAARKIAREYALRIDRDTFRFTTYPLAPSNLTERIQP